LQLRDMVNVRECESTGFITPDLCPPNNPDFSPVHRKIWGIIPQRVYKTTLHIRLTWGSVWLMSGLEWNTVLFSMALT